MVFADKETCTTLDCWIRAARYTAMVCFDTHVAPLRLWDWFYDIGYTHTCRLRHTEYAYY
jgi:hypothetical protein